MNKLFSWLKPKRSPKYRIRTVELNSGQIRYYPEFKGISDYEFNQLILANGVPYVLPLIDGDLYFRSCESAMSIIKRHRDGEQKRFNNSIKSEQILII